MDFRWANRHLLLQILDLLLQLLHFHLPEIWRTGKPSRSTESTNSLGTKTSETSETRSLSQTKPVETRWNHGARETQRRNAFSSLRTLTPSVNAAAAGVLEFWESHLIINGANCSSANLADFLDQNDQSQPDCRSGFIVTCDHMCCPLQKLSQVGAKLGPRLRSFQQELCHQILQNGIHLLLDILLMLLSHCRGALPRLNLPRRTAWQHRQSWCHAKMTRRCFFDQKWWSENHGCAEITFRVGLKKKFHCAVNAPAANLQVGQLEKKSLLEPEQLVVRGAVRACSMSEQSCEDPLLRQGWQVYICLPAQ